jgi:hypothetical protein
MRRLLFFCWLWAECVLPSEAAIRSVALSGNDVPGIAGAKFASFIAATINSTGQVVFKANLQQGLGGITSSNDLGLFASTANSAAIVAQVGGGNVPEVPGASFANIARFAVDDSGTVFLRGTLSTSAGGVTANDNQGFWKFVSGGNQLLARTGIGDAPGFTGVGFASLDFNAPIAPSGRHAFTGLLQQQAGITTTSNAGMWHFDSSGGSLDLQEGVSIVPGVPGANFESFVSPVLNSSQQFAFRGLLRVANDVVPENREGVWRYTYGTGELLARTGSGNVPGLPGANFVQFFNPVMNETGQLTFAAILTTGIGGVWKYPGSTGDLLAVQNGSVPELAGASFLSFANPQIDSNGRVVVLADMNVGPGGVTSANDTGLWVFDTPGGDQLLLREGVVGGVPGLAGASFSHLGDYSLNSTGTVAIEATLQTGLGGVDSSNSQGIWILPPEGNGQIIARTGQQLAGRTISALSLLPEDTYTNPVRGFSSQGELVFRALFTDSSSGLFVYTPGQASAADFDSNGYVDQDDLTIWQGAYGSTSLGDANGDGVSNGYDFLLWQRQYTGPGPIVAGVAVPEPSALWLRMLCCALAGYVTLRK